MDASSGLANNDREDNLRSAASLKSRAQVHYDNIKQRAIDALDRAIEKSATTAKGFNMYIRTQLMPNVRRGQYAMWPGLWMPTGAGQFSIQNVDINHWTVLVHTKSQGLQFFHIVPSKTQSSLFTISEIPQRFLFYSWHDAIFWFVGQNSLQAANPTQFFYLDLLPEDATFFKEELPLIFPNDLKTYNANVKTLTGAYVERRPIVYSRLPPPNVVSMRAPPAATLSQMQKPLPQLPEASAVPEMTEIYPPLPPVPPSIQYSQLPRMGEPPEPISKANIKSRLAQKLG